MENDAHTDPRHEHGFVAAMVRLHNEKFDSIRRRIAQAHTAAKTIQSLLRDANEPVARGKLQTQLRQQQGMIRALRARAPEENRRIHKHYRDMYGRIRAIPMVRDAYVGLSPYVEDVEPCLCICTDMLYGRSTSGSWHRVGRFIIAANFTEPLDDINIPLGGVVRYFRWKNLDGMVEGIAGPRGGAFGLWQAPTYIDSDGYAQCFGHGRRELREHVEAGDWPWVFATLIRFVECPGQRNSIRLWPRVDEDEVPSWYLDTFAPQG